MRVRHFGWGLLLWCTLCCACAPGGPSPAAERLAAQLDRPLRQCPERLWPGVDFGALQVVLLDHGRQQAFVWTGGTALREVEYLAMLDRFGDGPYATGQLDGRPTLGLDVGRQGALALGLHEGFHLVGQAGWDRTGLERGLWYPEDPRPRYLREQLVRALAAALRADAPADARAAAAHWQQRLAGTFPTDAARTRATDVLEGSARYVEVVGAVLGEYGCEADEEGVLVHARALQPSHFDEGKDPESYTLGALAGVLLRRSGRVGWEAQVARGQPPAALLLGELAPVAQPDDEALLGAVTDYYAAQNATAARAVEPFLASAADSGRVLLVVPATWQHGTVGAEGFVTVEEDGQPLRFLLSTYASYASPEDTPASLTLNGADVLRTAFCGSPGVAVAVPADRVRADGLGVRVDDEHASGGGWAVEQRADAHGRAYLCPAP